MVEAEEVIVSAPAGRQKYFRWLLSIFYQPLRTMQEIAGENRQAWPLPLLFLSILTISAALAAGPLRQQAALSAGVELPPSFQYMTPEQQQQFMLAQQNMNGPTTTVLFPAVGAIVGLWFGWLILGSVLHLVLTLLGSRSTNLTAYNVAAWSSLPFAIRLIVQITAMLSTHQLISSPGLSGFIATDAAQALLFVKVLLRMVDLYLIWQIILLFLGMLSSSGLSRGKTLSGILITVLLLVILSTLPGFFTAQFSALNITRPFLFY